MAHNTLALPSCPIPRKNVTRETLYCPQCKLDIVGKFCFFCGAGLVASNHQTCLCGYQFQHTAERFCRDCGAVRNGMEVQ